MSEPAELDDVLLAVAAGTTILLALLDLHLELVTGTVAWLAAWWLMHEPGARSQQPRG